MEDSNNTTVVANNIANIINVPYLEDIDNLDKVHLSDIYLPNKWILFLYDKALFKKITNRPNFQGKPYKEVCSIETVNDLIYILKIMRVRNDTKLRIDLADTNRTNLDANDYIIMREGIEPIWEDPKNKNGGTFSIKMGHTHGQDVWETFLLHMLGETLTSNMETINGISVSYIFDSNSFSNVATNKAYTYIKVWDGKPDSTRDAFVNSLPPSLVNKIKDESLKYTPNNEKKHYGQEDIISKLRFNQRNGYGQKRGGFSNFRRR